MGEYLYEELRGKIIGAAYEVHNALGKGLSEKAYENALALRPRQFGFAIEQQKRLPVFFLNLKVSDQEVDLLVEEKIIVEVKARSRLIPSHVPQVLGYLKNTKYQLALLLNFGDNVEIKRLILTSRNR